MFFVLRSAINSYRLSFMTPKENIEYPVRINRYLLLKGYASRRKADELIEGGHVKINGKTAVLGAKVQKGDKVTVSDTVKKLKKSYRYFAFNKPRGIVSHNPQGTEKSIEDVSGLGTDVFPVGRLDKDSHGLILLTNDGRIVNKLLNKEFGHEREYVVRVDKNINSRFLKNMREGVDIEGYVTLPAKVSKVNDITFRIILTEGKRHQIRRMTMALGYQVQDLKRVRIMNVKLGNLKEGVYRELKEKELSEFLKGVGV